jgi:WD40 repeat protein
MLAIWIDGQIIVYPLTYPQLATASPPTPMHLEPSHLRAGTGEVLRWSPNGDHLAAGASNGVITCWGSDGQVWRITPEGPKVTSLAWSLDNSLLIAGLRDKQIIGWDIRTRNILFRWSNLADMPRAVSIARHGRIAVASGAKRLLFGLPQEAAPSAQCAGQLLVSWSPTRRELATLDDQRDTTLIFWHEPDSG